jgi:DNA-binding protein YbaB
MNIEQLKQAQELVDRMKGINYQIDSLESARENGEIVDLVFRGTRLPRRIGKDAHHGEITLIRDKELLNKMVDKAMCFLDAEVQQVRSQLKAMGVSE